MKGVKFGIKNDPDKLKAKKKQRAWLEEITIHNEVFVHCI